MAKRVLEKQVELVAAAGWGFVVASKVVPINEHESRYTLELVRQAVENLGKGSIKMLLIDRGVLGGADLWTLKHDLVIEFVIPAKDERLPHQAGADDCRARDQALSSRATKRQGD